MKRIALALIFAMTVGMSHAADYDSYGGWTALRFEARERFYTTQHNGIWWLVTPKGYAFFSKGINAIRYGGDVAPTLGYSPYQRAAESNYGSSEKWAEATAVRLREWGFNTIGSWADPVMFEQKTPYTLILNIGARAGANWQKGTMPDFFSQSFREAAREVCRDNCMTRRNDPYLVGYFTDNELAWSADWRGKKSLLMRYLDLPARSAGRRAAESFLAKRSHTLEQVDRTDEEDFLFQAAAEYFRICHEAIRAADPNHLILGCRFAGHAPEPVVRAMKGYVDIVSFNSYRDSPPAKTLTLVNKLTGAPVMVTEFGFKAKDSGLPNTKGAGKPLETQKDRADGFERYVTELAKTPFCIGFHWFQYCDQPKEGRFDGENSNYGLVRTNDEPWEILTERMTSINPMLEAIHTGKSR